MAKKQRTEGQARADFISLCCIIALFLAALLIFINNVLPLIGVNISGGLIGAWRFVRNRGKLWRILYIVAIVLYVASAICGLF